MALNSANACARHRRPRPQIRSTHRILLLPILGLLLSANGAPQSDPLQEPVGESVDVRLGFVRITVPDPADRPLPEEIEVTWKGVRQRVVRVVGGVEGSLELGIAVDRSASMGHGFDSMRTEVLRLVEQDLSGEDRVFVMGFSDRQRVVAEGQSAAARELRDLGLDPEGGNHPTAFFDSLNRALTQFENADSRAALVVASDGCNSAKSSAGAAQVARRAADLAIPIFLVSPGQDACQNTSCTWVEPGHWRCTAESPPSITSYGNRAGPGGKIRLSGEPTSGVATLERDRFIGLMRRGGGELFAAKSADDWTRAFQGIREVLARQWTVVFEPSASKVKSSEVKVARVNSGRRSRLRDRSVQAERGSEGHDGVPPAPTGFGKAPEPAGEKIEVEVVNVDVVAVGKKGRRVLDLTQAEFALQVDGKDVPIDYFSAPQGSSVDKTLPDPEISRGAEVEGGAWLVFDLSALDGQAVRQIVEGSRGLLSAAAEAGLPVLIASFSGALKVHVTGAIGSDEIRRALDRVLKLGGRGRQTSMDRVNLEADIRSAGRTRSALGQTAPGLLDRLDEEISRMEDQEVARQRRFLTALNDLVASTAPGSAQKRLILATPGFSAEPGSHLRALLSAVSGRRPEQGRLSGSAASPSRLAVHDELQKLTRAAQNARMTVYTIAPATSTASSYSAEQRSLGGNAAPAPRDTSASEAAFNLVQLSDSTGGKSFVLNSRLARELESIHDDSRATYSLGFQTGPAAGFGDHAIRVRVLRPGIDAKGRTSFRRRSPEDRQGEALSAAARSGVVTRSLALELQASPSEVVPGKSTRTVLVQLRIPIGELALSSAHDGTPWHDTLRIQLAVADATGELHLGTAEQQEISIPEVDLDQARTSFWSHRAEVEISAGSASVGALVVDQGSSVWATAACSIEVQ